VRVSLIDGQSFAVEGINRASGSRPGDKCLVAVRPESLQIEPAEGSNGDGRSNQLIATIKTLLFMGESHEADIEFPGGHMALVSLAPTRAWREGEAVRISLPPGKLQLWDRDPDTDGAR